MANYISGGIGWDGGLITPPASLNPPLNANAQATSSSSIRLIWDAPEKADATGYRVYEVALNGDATFVGFATWGIQQLDQIGLNPNTAHAYVVRTTDGSSLESVNSNIAIATTPDDQVQGLGIIVDTHRTATGWRFDDPNYVSNVQGSGILVDTHRSNNGWRFDDPTGELPPVIPVSAPTITGIQTLSSSALRITIQDNNVNPVDSFLVYAIETSGGADAPGYPKQIPPSELVHTLSPLSESTNYTVTCTATVGSDTSGLSNAVSASTSSGQTQPPSGPFTPFYFGKMNGTIGNNLSGSDFMFSAGETRYSNEQVKYGSSSARTFIANGTSGGGWGGGVSNLAAENITSGDELWVSFWVFVPTFFIAPGVPGQTTCSETMKWLRWRKKLPGSSENRGYCDLYVRNNDYATTAEFSHATYVNTGDRAIYPFNDGQWHHWEWYNKLSHTRNGITRLWQDGILTGERTDFQQMKFSNEYISDFLFLNFYNCWAPQDQWLWFDNLILATSNSPPTGTDSVGNIIIGDYQ